MHPQPLVAISKPDYIRLPRSGSPCPFCGLSRSSLDAITRPQAANRFKPPVARKILKQAGTRRGVRLINYASLMAYLDGLSNDANSEEVTPPADRPSASRRRLKEVA
jgi:hypothetical protein